MPTRIERPCKVPLCPNTTSDPTGYCKEHSCLAVTKRYDDRESASKRGYDKQWEKFRARYLQDNPLCADCLIADRLTPATDVHHIKKLRDYPRLKYEKTNLIALCGKCHKKRTARGE